MLKKITCFLLLFILIHQISAQILTKEDSLNAGLIRKDHSTLISGYGEAKVEYDMQYKTGVANLTRNILFVGHKFTDKIYFFSEMELENAKINNGAKGELSMEQLFLKFNINPSTYITAGLFIPRLGIINENHLPTTFNGNDRPFVEQLVIPATWRELGVAIYGNINTVPGLNYSFTICNGLNSAGFKNGSGIREGRYEGSFASASNLAVNGSLLYYVNHIRIQTSAYFGGSAGLTKRIADSLQLEYGAFGTPVGVFELNAQYFNKGISFKALASTVQIPDADKINRAYGNNTANSLFGAYAELGYNLLAIKNSETKKNLTLFARYEFMDLNQKIPLNGIANDILKKQYFIAGVNFQPIKGIAIKADYVFRQTGDPNPALLINPYPQTLPYYKDNGFFNLGIAYSF